MKINQLKAGVILSYIATFMSSAISIVYTPVMLRLLGQSQYGVYNIAAASASYLGLFNFGFNGAYARYYAGTKDNSREQAVLNGMFMTIFIILGIAALCAGAVLAENVHLIFKNGLTSYEIEQSKILIYILSIQMALSFPLGVFSSYIMVNERYVFLKGVNVIRIIISPIATIPVLMLGKGSVGMVIVNFAVSLLLDGINILYCLKRLEIKFDFSNMRFGLFKDVSAFSVFIFINMITDQINWGIDKYLLGIIRGSSDVAVYSIAGQFHNYYMSFSASISAVFIPRVNRMVIDRNFEVENLFKKVGRVQFMILSCILVGFIIFGQEFIRLWAGEDYNGSYYAALFLLVPVTIPLVQTIGLEIQRARNMHKFRSIAYFLISIGNLLISIPMCYFYGPAGAAAGTGISLILGNGIAMNWYYKNKMGLDIKGFWYGIIRLIPAAVIPAAIGLAMNVFINNNGWGGMFAKIGVYISVFALSMWNLGCNDDEKKYFASRRRA